MQKGIYLNLTLFMARLTAGSSKEILYPSVIILLNYYDNKDYYLPVKPYWALGEELQLQN